MAALVLAGAGMSCAPDATLLPRNPLQVRVAVISFDGLRPDAITAATAPALMRLRDEGAAATAQTVLPSLTLPAHTSMVTGLQPQRHGVTWNDDVTVAPWSVDLTTIFDYTKQAGFTSAFFAGKSKLAPLADGGGPTRVSLPPRGEIWKADTVAARVRAYLATERPDLIFIHLPDIDIAGHTYGWMSAEYLAAVRRADSAFAGIWTALKLAFGPDLTLIVTADHGGTGYGHADGSALATAVPWIAWGKWVVPGVLSSDVHVVDTGPTVLWLLRVMRPSNWDGVPVTGAFPALDL